MADDDCVCINGQRTVTDMWARQEAGIDKLWPASEIDQHRLGAHLGRARLGCLACWVDATHEQRRAHVKDPMRVPAPPAYWLGITEQWGRYTSALNTVFPCPTCRPKQFARWRHGCYRPNHVPKRCRLCKDEK